MEEEIWKIYKDTRHTPEGGLWEVSNYGRVKKNGKIIELKVRPNKYYSIASNHAHRIVAELFVPNPDNKPEVDHIDGNRLNNRADNLRWVTRKENLSNPITKQHMSEAHIGKQQWLGKHHSKESKRKMSEAKLGKHWTKIDGKRVWYD